MSFAADLEEAAGDEEIEFCVIGDMGWSDGYGADERQAGALAAKGKVLPWSEARALLDYRYDTGYGAPDCNAVYAWTPSRVIFVSQYDGATGVEWVPRAPVECDPGMPGG